jgi:hypothetical protein
MSPTSRQPAATEGHAYIQSDIALSGTQSVADLRKWMRIALAIGIVAALRFVVVLVRYDPYAIAKYFMADDAFYYFQVAKNLAVGLGSTFDGVHVTNGYHPLWLLISAAAFRVVGGSDAALMILYALQVTMLVVSALFLYLGLREIDRLAAVLTFALFLASTAIGGVLFVGMESAPAFLLASWLLMLALRRGRRFFVPTSWQEAIEILLLLLGLSLARLEAGLVAALWLITAFVLDARSGGRARLRIAGVALGLSAVAVTYVVVNLRLVGMPLPISGYVKAGHLASPEFAARVFGLHRDTFAGLMSPPGQMRWAADARMVAALIGVAGLIMLVRELLRHEADHLRALWPFLAFGVAFVAISSIVTGGSYGWYRWPALLCGVLATFAVVRAWLALRRSPSVWPAAVLLVAALSTGASWYRTVGPRTLADWAPMPGIAMDYTVRFIREQIPPGDRMGGISSGIFTYFSRRPIENLEGLANGVEFYRARANPRTYGAYLSRNHIRWVVVHSAHRDEMLEQLRQSSAIDTVVDIDHFYHLGLKRLAPRLADPNVYFVRLRT